MEATIVSWGSIGIMENEMETTIVYGGLYERWPKPFEPLVKVMLH